MKMKSILKKANQLFTLVCWICGIIVVCISIAGITQAQMLSVIHIFVVIIVLSVFLALVGIAKMIVARSSSADKYDVETSLQPKATRQGSENPGFVKSENGKDDSDTKWAKNYTPYGDHPGGKEAAVSQGSNVGVDEKAGRDNKIENQTEKKDWEKNYVPYQEEGQT